MDEKTDEQLMEQVRLGETDAFQTIYERRFPALFRFCLRYLGSEADAEDLTQETFLRAFRAADRFEPRAKVSTWLFTIARNLCFNRFRRAENQAAARDGTETEPDRLVSGRPDPEVQASQNETAWTVQKAIGDLPPSLRVPVLLRRYHELSYEEIARITGCSLSAVKLRLHRARGLLKKALTEAAPKGQSNAEDAHSGTGENKPI